MLSAGISAAQVKVIVEGSVKDPYGAMVMNAQIEAKLLGSETQKTLSDSTGAFSFSLTKTGTYNLHATADGYMEPSMAEGYRGIVNVTDDDKDTKPTVRRVKLILYRPGTVRGRLVKVEKEVKKAVAKQSVLMVLHRYFEGQLSLTTQGESGVTDANGDFVIEKVPPGEYFLQIAPTVLESVAAKAAKKPVEETGRPHGYRRTYWPEDAESGYAKPMKVDSGAILDVGEIEVKPGPFFQISGTIEFTNCADGDKLSLSLSQQYGYSYIPRVGTSFDCRTPFAFTFQNVSPGSYQMKTWIQGKPALEREAAGLSVTVSDEDVEVALRPRRPYRLQGKVELPENFPPDRRAALKVALRSILRLTFPEEQTLVPVDEDGKFSLPMFEAGESEVHLPGLQLPYYLKSVSYNSLRLPGAMIASDPYTIDHHIDITVSDKPGTLEGSVTVKGDAAPLTRVLIGRWPFVLKAGYPVFLSCRTDEKGHFSQTGLAPGVYRAVAVDDSIRWRIERREDAMEILSSGKEVEITEGVTRSVELEIGAW